MDLFLLLTALLCGLTGVNRSAVEPARVVEAARSVEVARAVARIVPRVVAPRPEGYVAVEPARLELTLSRSFALRPVPERRRE